MAWTLSAVARERCAKFRVKADSSRGANGPCGTYGQNEASQANGMYRASSSVIGLAVVSGTAAATLPLIAGLADPSIFLAAVSATTLFASLRLDHGRPAHQQRDGEPGPREIADSAQADAPQVRTQSQSPSPSPSQSDLEASIPVSNQVCADLLAERMSHDLRTPLNAVIGFSELMQHELHGPHTDDRYREYAALIRQSGEQLRRTTEDTIAVTRLFAETRTSADQAPRARSAKQLLKDAVDAADLSCPVSVRIEDELSIEVQPEAFRQALQRLLGQMNADNDTNQLIEITVQRQYDFATIRIKASNLPEASSNHIRVAPTANLTPCYPTVTQDLDTCLIATLFELQGLKLRTQCFETNDAACLAEAEFNVPCATQAQLHLAFDTRETAVIAG